MSEKGKTGDISMTKEREKEEDLYRDLQTEERERENEKLMSNLSLSP